MKYHIEAGGRTVWIQVDPQGDGTFRVAIEGAPPRMARLLEGTDGEVIQIGSRIIPVRIEGRRPPSILYVAARRRGVAIIENERERSLGARRPSDKGTQGIVCAPMPGKIARICVQPGDEVEQGTPLVVMSAMKMENELLAGVTGRVEEVYVGPGDTVESGAKLVRIGKSGENSRA